MLILDVFLLMLKLSTLWAVNYVPVLVRFTLEHLTSIIGKC